MAFPLAALFGAGGSIASAILGADAQDTAAKYNYAAQMANLREQKKARQQAIDYAEEVRGDQKLGGTDALGNRTYFKEGVGWVVDLDPQQQALYDYFFNQELPERQAQFQRGAEQSRQGADEANQLLGEFNRVQKLTPQEAEAQLYEAATRGQNEGTRNATEAAMRQAVRTGSSNIGDIIGSIAKSSMEASRDARTQAGLQARDYVDQKYNSERGNLANLYNMFLGASQRPLNASYDPTGLPSQANQLMSLFSQQGSQGNAMGYNALTQPVPLIQQIQPNTAWANAAGAIGTSLMGLGDRISSSNNQSQMNDLMKMYITNGGQLDLGSGGLFDAMTKRVNGGGGIF